jgi:type IX secretion system PorP/SprF family membrane protein
LSYNYQIPFLDGTLGIGIQGGMSSMGLKLTDIRTPDNNPNDPVLQDKQDASQMLFDFGAGLFYRVFDQYEIGISLGHINQPESDHLNYKQRRCLNLSGSYNFTLAQFPRIDFVPSTLIKSDFTSMQIDLSLVGLFNKQYWGGVTYRLGDAIVLLGGLNLRQFPLQVGVAYDLATNWMFRASKIGGGFEVFARYSFNLSVDRIPQSYKNSRFL